eukprot:4220687-Amphidinium_carterae.1
MGESPGRQDPKDLADQVHGARCVATHHCALMPSIRRLGLKLWWSTSGSNGNTPRNTEKAWVDTTD